MGHCMLHTALIISLSSPSAVYFSTDNNIYPHEACVLFRPANNMNKTSFVEDIHSKPSNRPPLWQIGV